MDIGANEHINYEQLVKDYNDSLNSVLRGFRPKYDFLEMWVPDANHLRSVVNLVESARDQGHATVALFFSKDILKQIDLPALVKELQPFGKIEQSPLNGGTLLHLNRGMNGSNGQDKAANDIAPLYKEKIVELHHSLSHQGSILEDGDNLLIRSTKDGISLFGAIDVSAHTIHRARFSGTNKTVEAGLLEGLCRIIEGLPIQEAYDHAIIKLEAQLRDKTKPAPVQGIVNLFNYPPMFDLPLKLLRDLYATYIKKTGYKPGDNFFTKPVSNAWKALPDNEKAAAVTRAFTALLAKEGTPYSKLPLELHVMGVELHHKINIGIQGEIAPEARAKLFLDFETVLRRELEPSLEIFSQNFKDRNTIRRL